MVYELANLKVESYETWKTFFDKRSDTREGSGAKEAHLFRNSDDPNEVLYYLFGTLKKMLRNIWNQKIFENI